MKAKIILYVLLLVLNFQITSALIITEIQADPKLSETVGEWIEIYNDEDQVLNITDYVFNEGSDRTLSAINGASLAPGEYAVIVEDVAGFNADPDNAPLSTKLFLTNSKMTLTNTGELLSIKKNGQSINSYAYGSSTSGKSWQLVNGVWSKSIPTPGRVNIAADIGGSGSGSSTSTSTATTTVSTATITPAVQSNIVYVTKTYWPTSEKIYVNAGENKIALTGSQVIFEGKAMDSDKKNINTAEFNWSFGDGFTKSGSKEAKHIYHFPGEYTAIFEVSNGEKIEQDRIYVKVIDASLSIKIGTDRDLNYVELTNNNNEEIKLDGLTLRELGEASTTLKSFTFPKNFSILPKRSVKIVNEVLQFSSNIKELGLYYSTGKLMSSYANPKYLNISIASTTAVSNSINLATTTNVILNNISNINSSSTISTATKKYIKNYVKNYTANLSQNLGEVKGIATSTSVNVATNTNKKVLINRENKTLWQKLKTALGV